jgi:hypothetical protein
MTVTDDSRAPPRRPRESSDLFVNSFSELTCPPE